MANQKDLDSTYMGVAMLHAKLSKASRSRVGAVLKPYRNCFKVFHYERIRLNNESRK